ncbi:MAG: ribosome maturation factor RimM [Bacteroidota bacterium]
MKSINRKDFIVAGTVAKTHGTKGELKIITDAKVKFTEWAFLEIREKPVPFYIRHNQATTNNEYLLKLDGIDTLEIAQQYIGYQVLVTKTKGKRKPTENVFDLNGFMLIDVEAGEIGEVAGIEELPQQTMLVTHYHGQQIMIPMVEDFIDRVDEKKEIIYLRLPDGFLELYD